VRGPKSNLGIEPGWPRSPKAARDTSSEVGGETYSQHRARLRRAREDLSKLDAQQLSGDLLPVHDALG
jgi:hypothetical protein